MAQAFFERALAETGVTPKRVVIDKATCYPPARKAVLPGAEHRRSKYLNNGLERDHQHFTQRVYPLRRFKQAVSADIMVRGYALMQNLRNDLSRLTAHVPRQLRLAAAWSQLTQAI